MRRRPVSTRCVAPARSRAGVVRCVVNETYCIYPGHARWRRIAPVMRLVWWIKPWWPNKLGRAMDRAGRGNALNEQFDRQDGAA